MSSPESKQAKPNKKKREDVQYMAEFKSVPLTTMVPLPDGSKASIETIAKALKLDLTTLSMDGQNIVQQGGAGQKAWCIFNAKCSINMDTALTTLNGFDAKTTTELITAGIIKADKLSANQLKTLGR